MRAGHPWAFSNEILMDAETKALPPGSLATLRAPSGEALGARHLQSAFADRRRAC